MYTIKREKWSLPYWPSACQPIHFFTSLQIKNNNDVYWLHAWHLLFLFLFLQINMWIKINAVQSAFIVNRICYVFCSALHLSLNMFDLYLFHMICIYLTYDLHVFFICIVWPAFTFRNLKINVMNIVGAVFHFFKTGICVPITNTTEKTF